MIVIVVNVVWLSGLWTRVESNCQPVMDPDSYLGDCRAMIPFLVATAATVVDAAVVAE